jgi:hypothetical protein
MNDMINEAGTESFLGHTAEEYTARDYDSAWMPFFNDTSQLHCFMRGDGFFTYANYIRPVVAEDRAKGLPTDLAAGTVDYLGRPVWI